MNTYEFVSSKKFMETFLERIESIEERSKETPSK